MRSKAEDKEVFREWLFIEGVKDSWELGVLNPGEGVNTMKKCILDFLACSEAVQASENKDMFLSFERIPVLDSSRKRGLSSDQEFNSTNLLFARVNVFSHCSAQPDSRWFTVQIN